MDLRPFNIASFCSGAGMLDEGVEAAAELCGLGSPRVVVHVEREAFAASVLASRMEAQALAPAPIWSDVRSFDGRRWRGIVDLLAAGIPCQGNSLAGKRLLEADPRDLWPDTRRALRDTQPGWFFLENVYGLLVPDRRQQREAPIRRILRELAEDGWDAEWGVFSAASVGAPHRRERVFVLAHRAGRGLGELRKPSRRDGLADGGHADVDHAQRLRSRAGDQGQQGQAGIGRGGPPDAGDELGDTDRRSIEGRPAAGLEGQSGSSAGHRGMADTRRPRRQGRQQRAAAGEGAGTPRPAGELRGHAIPPFPPGPGDRAAWADIIACRPDLSPAIEPAVRGVADGMADRRDRIRLCGNGVVPLAAAAAFRVLHARLTS
ncbi:MAG: DNA cytosine methyltransferase [Phycisphaerales bacterium]|nr:DNA cytosine methyltransferase [Phycisphaerales bacterium]